MSNKYAARLGALALVVSLTGAAQTASAESCTLRLHAITTETGCVMRSNHWDHYLHISASRFAHVTIQDVDTRVYVLVETAGVFGLSRTVTGLYGTYIASGIMPPTIEFSFGTLTMQNI